LPPIEFTISIRRPLSHDITDDEEDKENIPSSGDKHEVPGSVDACDLSHGGKEEMVETPKITRFPPYGSSALRTTRHAFQSHHHHPDAQGKVSMAVLAVIAFSSLKVLPFYHTLVHLGGRDLRSRNCYPSKQKLLPPSSR
jgi:hypothetical protein